MASKKKKTPIISDEERALFLKAVEETETTLSPELFQKQRQTSNNKNTQTKAAPRHSGPDAVIDLHACTLELALSRTEEFLLRCHGKKFRKVLVIHGKGSGVLKEGVRKYLTHHPLVAQIDEAERQHGGSGAVMVLLRR
jgi:DNA mismatch repair protein MutS2